MFSRVKIEKLDSKVTEGVIHEEVNYHQKATLLPLLEVHPVIHAIEEIDLKNNVIRIKADNGQPDTAFLGIRNK